MCKQSHVPKYTTHSTPLTLLATLGSSLMNNSPFLTKFIFLSKSCYYHICAIIIFLNFVVSALTSIPQQSVPLPPPSFTPNLITVILFTTISEFQITHRQLIQICPAYAVKDPKSCHITSYLMLSSLA